MSTADEGLGTLAQEMVGSEFPLNSVLLGINPLGEAFKILSNNLSASGFKLDFSEDPFERMKTQRLVNDLFAILEFRKIGATLLSEFLAHVWLSARLVPSQMKVEGIFDVSLYPFAATSTSNVKEGMLLSGKRVALKSVRKSQTQPASEGEIKRLFFEGLISSTTCHPNIMPCLGTYICLSGDLHLVSRLQKNGSLPDYLARHPEVDKLCILEKIALAVVYLHSLPSPILHGDIRGTNVLVDDVGDPLLMDLGCSMIMDPITGTFSPISHIFAGNPRYTSYEKLSSNEFPLTLKADIFSYASLMFEVLSGEVPYRYLNRDSAVILEVLRRKCPRRPNNPKITDPLWDLMTKCWSVDPAHRPSMEEVYLTVASLARSRKA